MQIYLYISEQQVGPYERNQLQQLVVAGELAADTPAWHEGLTEWRSVAAILETEPQNQSAAILQVENVQATAYTPDVNCVRWRFTVLVSDASFFFIVTLPLSLSIAYGLTKVAPDLLGNVVSSIAFLASAPFVAFFMSSRFQATPAMIWYKLIITDKQGLRISYGRALVRHLVSIFSYILLAGFLLSLFNKKRQTLHDMVAGTMVIKRPPDFKSAKSPWLPIIAIALPSLVLSAAILSLTGIGEAVLVASDPDRSGQTQSDATTAPNDNTQKNTSAPPSSAQTEATNAASTPNPSTTSADTNTAPSADVANLKPQPTSDTPANGDDDNVTKVKASTLDFDNTVKIGPALEGYSFFKNVVWKSFQTSQGRTVVEATAVVDPESYKNTNLDENGTTKLPAEWVDSALKNVKGLQIVYTAQFELSQTDDTIAVGYSGYTIKATMPGTGEAIEQELKDDEDLKGLRAVFANVPDVQVSAIFVAFSQIQQPPQSAPAPQPAQ